MPAWRKKKALGKSGYVGVDFYKPKQKWQARITVKGKRHHLGFFQTPEEASEAYQKAEKEFFTEEELKPHDVIEYGKQYRAKNREKVLTSHRLYNAKHKNYLNKRSVINNRKLKTEVINRYGGVCVCCGESRIEFLSIDHALNNGAEHRKQMRKEGNCKTYQWLKKNNFPEEGFQVLCMNCNCSKGLYGYCPHNKPNEKFIPEE